MVKNLIERAQDYITYIKENPKKAREEITDLIMQNFRKAYGRVEEFVAPIAKEVPLGLMVFGGIKYVSGIYEMDTTYAGPTEGLIDCLIGVSMMFIGFAVGSDVS